MADEDDTASPTAATDQAHKRYLDQEAAFDLIDAVRGKNVDTPVTPVKLTAEDTFCFNCHKDVSCWNVCCHGADITLTPNCILRLSKHLDLKPAAFLQKYTVPAEWAQAGLPVAKLKMGGNDGKGPCAFMTDAGCSVYEDRPATCRYYPMGLASVKLKGAEQKEDFYFLVREDHCKGHQESNEQSVGQYRIEQGVEDYDRINRGWMDILMKMASWKVLGGPWGKEPLPQVKQMFFLASTDVEGLRQFVFETKFLETYEISPEAVELLKTDDQAMLQLGFDWMKSIMFNEDTMPMKEHVIQGAIAKAREGMGVT